MSSPPFRPTEYPDRDTLERAAQRFLIWEAALLDDRHYDEWMGLLTDDFHYRIPLPTVREDPRLPRHSDRALLFEATKRNLGFKLGRVGEKAAWADRPQNMTRRFVSNVTIEAAETGDLVVRSSLLLTTSPSGEQPTIVSAGREDHIRIDPSAAWCLASRSVFLDVEIPTGLQLSTVL